MNVRELVSAAKVSLRGRRSSVLRRYDEYVRAAAGATEIDPDALADFFAEHGFDMDDFMLEVELIEQRAEWRRRAEERPQLDAAVHRARAALADIRRGLDGRLAAVRSEPAGEARAARLAGLLAEAAVALDAARSAVMRAEQDALGPGHAAGRVVELDNAIEQLRQRRGAGVPRRAADAKAAAARALFAAQQDARAAEARCAELRLTIARLERSPGDDERRKAKRLGGELAATEGRAQGLRDALPPLERTYRECEAAAARAD